MSKTDTPKVTPFETEFSQFEIPRIESLETLTQLEGTPAFIQQVMLNKQKVVFLGQPQLSLEKLKGKSYRVDNMVLPPYVRMVNIDSLRKELNIGKLESIIEEHTASGLGDFLKDKVPDVAKDTIEGVASKILGNNEEPINVDGEDFFIGEKINHSIKMNVVGMVSDLHFNKMHFHSCKNHKIEVHTPQGGEGFGPYSKAKDGSANCQQGHTKLDLKETDEKAKQELALFYLDIEDIKVSWSDYEGEHPTTPILSPEKFLKLYFTDDHFDQKSTTEDDNPSKDKVEHMHLKGVFLVPVTAPDGRVMYQCLLNIEGESNTKKTVRENLKRWIAAVDKLNEDPQHVFEVGGNDFTYMWIEPWSCFIGRNFQPVVAPASDLYHDGLASLPN